MGSQKRPKPPSNNLVHISKKMQRVAGENMRRRCNYALHRAQSVVVGLWVKRCEEEGPLEGREPRMQHLQAERWGRDASGEGLHFWKWKEMTNTLCVVVFCCALSGFTAKQLEAHTRTCVALQSEIRHVCLWMQRQMSERVMRDVGCGAHRQAEVDQEPAGSIYLGR